MKIKTITIAFASLFLLASCTGNNKKVNENTLWEEKTETVAQTPETAETPEVTETATPSVENTATETKQETKTAAPEAKQETKSETAETEPADDDNKIYERPEEEAYSHLSNAEFMDFFNKHLVMPQSYTDNPFNASSAVHLTIEKDGTVSDVEILSSLSPDLDKEFIRVYKLLPKFEPGKVKGKPVRSKATKFSAVVRAM